MSETVNENYNSRQATDSEILSKNAFVKSRNRWHNKKMIRKIFSYCFAIVITVSFLVLCAVTFFRVGTINVTGNSIYSSEDIIESSGIEFGRNLYELNQSAIEDSIIAKNPFIKSVKVKREVPSTIELVIVEDSAKFYLNLFDEYYVLSDELRIMSKHSNLDEVYALNPSIIHFSYPKISYAIVGNEIEFEKEGSTELIKNIINDVETSNLANEINSVDFSDKFDISIICRSNRVRVQLGSYDKDFHKKLNFAYKVINDTRVADSYINVSMKYGDSAVVTIEKDEFIY